MSAKTTPHTNGFDCLRLLAAAAVLFSHCYYLLGLEPMGHAFDNPNIGAIAVYVFFGISGYLVTYSWQRDPDVFRFMIRRSLRIFPGLIFVIFLSFAVIGPLMTTLRLGDYFSSLAAWTYLLKIFIYPAQKGLPGVFNNNPLPDMVNGSLWSLRVEFSLYVAMALIGYFGLIRSKKMGVMLAALFFVGYLISVETTALRPLRGYEQLLRFLANAVPFFIGMALAQHSFIFRRPWLVAAALFVVSGLFVSNPIFKYVVVLTMPLLAILVAQNTKCNLSRFGDYSYGLYLWGYVAQQTLLSFVPSISFLGLFTSAMAIALLIAALSWHLVEKKALGYKPVRGKVFRAHPAAAD